MEVSGLLHASATLPLGRRKFTAAKFEQRTVKGRWGCSSAQGSCILYLRSRWRYEL